MVSHMGVLRVKSSRWLCAVYGILLLTTCALQVYNPDFDGDGQGEGYVFTLLSLVMLTPPLIPFRFSTEPTPEELRSLSRRTVDDCLSGTGSTADCWLLAKGELPREEWNVFYMHRLGQNEPAICCSWLHMDAAQFQDTLGLAEEHLGRAIHRRRGGRILQTP